MFMQIQILSIQIDLCSYLLPSNNNLHYRDTKPTKIILFVPQIIHSLRKSKYRNHDTQIKQRTLHNELQLA